MPSKINKLIQTIAAFDHRAGVFTAACCARTALEVVPEGEAVPLAQIEAVEAWVRGELDAAACMATFPSGSYYSVAAIGDLVRATAQGPDPCAPGDLGRVADSTAHTRAAVAVKSRIKSPEFKELRKRALEQMYELARAASWPATRPSEAQLAAAEAPLRAAWDVVAEQPVEDFTIGELATTSKRAGRMKLDLDDPVARAIAERSTSPALTRKVRAALAG